MLGWRLGRYDGQVFLCSQLAEALRDKENCQKKQRNAGAARASLPIPIAFLTAPLATVTSDAKALIAPFLSTAVDWVNAVGGAGGGTVTPVPPPPSIMTAGAGVGAAGCLVAVEVEGWPASSVVVGLVDTTAWASQGSVKSRTCPRFFFGHGRVFLSPRPATRLSLFRLSLPHQPQVRGSGLRRHRGGEQITTATR